MKDEFSFKTRQQAISHFREETFDLLIIGGGITGAATARDAVSRGLKVALVEARDFAWGTSSRSSKLIHGGLRYLENMEMRLVFEALSERTHLLKAVPHLVRPLPFYMPTYEKDKPSKLLLTIGLWLYDLLSLFRTPGFHRRLSKKQFLKEVPFLKEEGLKGGFRYFDAMMWDDVLAVETLRDASFQGAAVANYVEAVKPLWEKDRIVGFQVRDREVPEDQALIDLYAKQVIVCAGPWTDELGMKLSPGWKRWLTPSKGIHLLFDLKKIPVPGAVVMSHPEDGRISFVIPRPDYGAGVVIVGTTDGPTPLDPEKVEVDSVDVNYLIDLLHKYFPKLDIKISDIISAYVGIRPLMGGTVGSEGQDPMATNASILQKVSREHYIGKGPGGVVMVAGGKYTTHRTMAKEIVDFALHGSTFSKSLKPSATEAPVNSKATRHAAEAAKKKAEEKGWKIPEELWSHYGAGALEIYEMNASFPPVLPDPEGFPLLEAQFRYNLRTSMVIHLEDFFLRRLPLYATRPDHALPWAPRLAQIWATDKGLSQPAIMVEFSRLQEEFERRSGWLARTKIS